MTRSMHRSHHAKAWSRRTPTAAPTPIRALIWSGRLALTLALASTLVGAAAPAAASEMVAELDPAATEVTFMVDATGHDVHGSFDLREGSIRFDPSTGNASGTLVVDATSGETGNGSRDETMHEKVLESESYPTFVFHAERVTGAISPDGESELEMEGTMEVHGDQHPFTIPATVTLDGDRFTGTARFVVPYVDWGLHNPSFLFLRVAKEVAVTVEASGTLRTADGAMAGADADGR